MWEGSLELSGNVVYFLQAVDNAGNVWSLYDSQPDQDSVGTLYGSTTIGVRTYLIDVQDSDGDGLPDSWENRYGLDPSDDGTTDALLRAFRTKKLHRGSVHQHGLALTVDDDAVR